MPATGAAFAMNAMLSGSKKDQDFSAVILEMEKRARLNSADKATTGITAATISRF
jgi:hypothetical protein